MKQINLFIKHTLAIIYFFLAVNLPIATASELDGSSLNGLISANENKILLYNNEYKERFKEIIKRSTKIHPSKIPQDVKHAVCGPAAIYAALPETQLENKDFSEFLYLLTEEGLFRSGRVTDLLLYGMATRDLKKTFKYLGLGGESFQLYSSKYLAEKAVKALDDGQIILAEVDSNKSYEAISGLEYPGGSGTRHIVALVALQRDLRMS